MRNPQLNTAVVKRRVRILPPRDLKNSSTIIGPRALLKTDRLKIQRKSLKVILLAQKLFSDTLANTPLQEMTVNNVVISFLKLNKTMLFKCLSIVDHQIRTVDIVDDSKSVVLARDLSKVDFHYIQKSQIYVIAKSLVVVVSNNEGQLLSKYIFGVLKPIDERFLRDFIRDILEALIYISEYFRIDFEFGANDVIVCEGDSDECKIKFKLRNNFIQKSDLYKLQTCNRANTEGHNFPTTCSKIRLTSVIPRTALRSLGILAITLAKNRFGFCYSRSNMDCPWFSESLNDIITGMINSASNVSLSPSSILKRLMTGTELKLERGKIAHQAFDRYSPGPRVSSQKRNSNPF
jgi:hypothetical protein